MWANLLHNVYAALVGAHGWSATARTNPTGTEGNIVHLHLYLDALILQPCNPTCKYCLYLPLSRDYLLIFPFPVLTARDAWIQADANRYGGANFCTLWKAFASRGVGVNAANHRNDFTVPSNC